MSESRPLNPQGYVPPKISGVPNVKAPAADLDPIDLVDEPTASGPPVSKIRNFSVAGMGPASHSFKRQPVVTGQGAVRVRSFHGRLSDEGLAYMDDKINEWIDEHPDIEVKFVTTTIGQFEGKIREPALVVNIWY